MTTVAAERELFDACRVIFGLEHDVSREFLEYIQPSGIKTAYRQKARETHPDLVATQSEQVQRRHAQLFTSVQHAYEKLNRYLEAREKGFRFQAAPWPAASATPQYRPPPAARPSRPRNPATPKITIDRSCLYTGNIPNHRLLFGHYLYYAGHINWRTIIQALVWQRGNRPRLGELGSRLGWLNREEILMVLQHRTLLHPFGESAVELGYLTEIQLKSLLHQQKRLQKKFGEFFVEHDLFSDSMMELLARNHRRHNALVTSPGRQGCRF